MLDGSKLQWTKRQPFVKNVSYVPLKILQGCIKKLLKKEVEMESIILEINSIT